MVAKPFKTVPQGALIPLSYPTFAITSIDCDIADGVDVAQLDHLVGQKAQRPAGVSLGRITAGKCDESGFDVASNLGRCSGTGFIKECRLQAFVQEGFSGANNGS